jgi:hypothetical protein
VSWPARCGATKRSQKPSYVYEALGRRKYLDRTEAASAARQIRHRRGVGLTDAQVQRSLTHRARIPDIPDRFEPGTIRVLTGPLGSGKSEIAEEGFCAQVTRAQAEKGAPIPIWIAIDELDSALEDKVIAGLRRDALASASGSVRADGAIAPVRLSLLTGHRTRVARYGRCR